MTHVRFRVEPPLARVTLDRPKALHALDEEMVRDLHAALESARIDDRVRAVVLRGDARAFCAGGDVRAVVLAMRAGHDLARTFFLEEYALNHAIARFAARDAGARGKPWVAIVDGIVMGGGAGISVHGSHRIATENTVFAMPETAIGFFPDVGATHFLSRCPGEVGTWLGLTGARIGAADMLAAGLATHVVDSVVLDILTMEMAVALKGLVRARASASHDAIDEALADHAHAPAPVILAPANRAVIDRCFAFDHVHEIVAALERTSARAPHDDERASAVDDESARAFAREALATLKKMSPTSLVITLALLRAGRTRTLEECLAAEYRAAHALAWGERGDAGRIGDFEEGVRAMLIDKEKAPQWSPARLEDVDEARVLKAIARAPARDLAL